MEDSRIVLIDKDGNVTIIFSSNEEDSNNIIEIPFGEDLSIIEKYIERIQGKLYRKNDCLDRHLYYLQDYLKNHYVDDFKKIGYNPQREEVTDLTLYFFLSEMGVVSLINSSEHKNLFFAPRTGMSEKQEESVKEIFKLFDEDITWIILDEARLVEDESNGKKSYFLDLGERKQMKTNEYINGRVKKK